MDLVQEVLAADAWNSPASTLQIDAPSLPSWPPAASTFSSTLRFTLPTFDGKIALCARQFEDVRNNSVCFWCWQDEENGNEKGKHLSLLLITPIKTCLGEDRRQS